MDEKSDKEIIFPVTNRLSEICEIKNYKYAFLHNQGVAKSQTIYDVMKGKQKPGIDFLIKFLELVPEFDANWVLFGEGEMYKEGYVVKGHAVIRESKQNIEDLKLYNRQIIQEKDSRISDLQEQVKTLKEIIQRMQK